MRVFRLVRVNEPPSGGGRDGLYDRGVSKEGVLFGEAVPG